MALPYSSIPVSRAGEEARVAFLQRVLGVTFVGLGIAAVTSIVSTFVLASLGPAALSGYVPMIVILGCWAVSNYVAQPMVFGGAKWAGLVLGTATQGVAMGFLLLAALIVSSASVGNPFTLVGLAMGLTFFSGLGMAAYVWQLKRDFSMIGAGLAALSLPMLILMGVTFAFPNLIGGTAGIVLSGVFVLVSAAGLLYQLNRVVHDFRTDMHVEGGYTIAMGLLVLFWNILSLLMRLTRR